MRKARVAIPVQPQEEYWLDLMAGVLEDSKPKGTVWKKVSSGLDTGSLVEASRTDPMCWGFLQAAVADLQEQGPEAVRDAVGSPVLEWALDVAVGNRERPRGRNPLWSVTRSVIIAWAVGHIDELGHRPLKTSAAAEDSVCHIVGKRAHCSPGRVYDFWKERSSGLDK